MRDAAPHDPPDALIRAVAARVPDVAGPWVPLEGGRVNRLWRAGDVVVKAFDPEGGSVLFPNSAVAEAAALRFAAPHGIAPALLAEGPGWVVWRHVEGAPWREDAAVAGRLLARLHGLAPPAGFAVRAGGSAAVLAQGAEIGAPWPAPADPGVGPPARQAPLHGDPVPGNIVVGGGRAVLIDWQCPAAGDAAEDIALFLSPAMQWLYRGAPLSGDERAAFLAAYGDAAVVARYRAMAAVLHWRIAAHCAWRAARGDAGYAAALRLERDGH